MEIERCKASRIGDYVVFDIGEHDGSPMQIGVRDDCWSDFASQPSEMARVLSEAYKKINPTCPDPFSYLLHKIEPCIEACKAPPLFS